MNHLLHVAVRLMVLCLLTTWWHSGVVAGQPASNPIVVRIGAVAFEDFDLEREKWDRVLGRLSAGSATPWQFQIAVGTYGDVLHWMQSESIDVGILTSGVFVEQLRRQESGQAPVSYEYLASVGLPPATSHWADASRQAEGFHFHYRSVCIVPRDAPFQTADDLLSVATAGKLQFIFVHPLSVSGRIAPEFALKQLGSQVPRNQVAFSHSHSGSLRLLLNADPDRIPVAFVWDDALRALPELKDQVRRLPFERLDTLQIPHDVIVARRDFEARQALQQLLLDARDADGRAEFQRPDTWRTIYQPVADWSADVGISSHSADTQRVSLDEIGQILLHAVRSQSTPPRLAVVMSGGGAKCSYQVGAVAAVEEMLENLRTQHPDADLNIDLVVGTSGGAINAVPVALGISATAQGRDQFRAAWTRLDQRQIVRPSLVIRWNIAIWFAVAQMGMVLWLVRRRVATASLRPGAVATTAIVLGGLQLLVGYLPLTPWRTLGGHHGLHHAWLWISFGVPFSGWLLLTAGLGIQFWKRRLAAQGRVLTVPARMMAALLISTLILLPMLQLVTVLFFQMTLSSGRGIENALGTHFRQLIDNHLSRRSQPLLNVPSTRPELRLQEISGQIINRSLLERDLVITGNCLEQSAGSLPTDLYFFASRNGDQQARPPFGERGIRLEDHPQILMDVVMGSGSIFPVFPPRHIADFPEPRESVELIDGGFAHNSPIEAAVLWGATHVVLIEATPQRRRLRRNFAENVAAALVHLHKQTQLVDVRSKQQVMVFTLAPDPPHLCVLDFADNLIAESMDRGFRDARAGPTAQVPSLPRFRKELGQPVFEVIGLK